MKNVNIYESLGNFVGKNCLRICKNRFEKSCYSLNDIQMVERVFNEKKLIDIDNWKPLLNMCGCLVNEIKLLVYLILFLV